MIELGGYMPIKFKIFYTVLITSLCIMCPIKSYADWNGDNKGSKEHNGSGHHWEGRSHDHEGHDHGRHDHSFIGINFGILPEGYYYNAPNEPPVNGVLISPADYQPVVINGTTYYVNNGNYYLYNGYGYQSVPSPVVDVQPPPTVIGPSEPVPGDTDSMTINIPNKRGGYISVTLKKSGNGYIGPQGEFYQGFPKVSDLEVIYGN